jgi:hypothetical protein
MRGKWTMVFLGAALTIAPFACEAKVRITVDLSSQTMKVDSGSVSYSWPISSARDGYVTPRGHYGVQSLQPMHYSKKYHNSPMPHSIFFNGGFAIHGTYDLANLGRPASHGCVRISPAHAATLFSLVQDEGATIEIVGQAPAGNARVAAREPDASAPNEYGYSPRVPEAREQPQPVRHRAAAAVRVVAPSENPFPRIFGFAR